MLTIRITSGLVTLLFLPDFFLPCLSKHHPDDGSCQKRGDCSQHLSFLPSHVTSPNSRASVSERYAKFVPFSLALWSRPLWGRLEPPSLRFPSCARSTPDCSPCSTWGDRFCTYVYKSDRVTTFKRSAASYCTEKPRWLSRA